MQPPHARVSSSPVNKPSLRSLWIILFCGLIAACVGGVVAALHSSPSSPPFPAPGVSATTDSFTVEEESPSPEPAPRPRIFTIAATGDVLPHLPVHSSARTSTGYNFSPLFSEIDALVNSAGLALCHLEVPVIAKGHTPTGYPLFGASPAIVQALARQGWDGCSTASNHSIDKGFDGVVTTLDTLENNGLGFAGTARSQSEAHNPQIYDVHQDAGTTRIAHLSVTRHLNGLVTPQGKSWAVQRIVVDDVLTQARDARKRGADLVVVSSHDGIEYQSIPSAEQKEFAQALAESGLIDLYIGHHAHVPQPIERLSGGPHDDGMWVAYGLGNFISNQDSACCVPQTASSVMMFAHVEGTDEATRITQVSWRALTVDRKAGHIVRDLSALHTANKATDSLSSAAVEKRYTDVRTAVGTEASELTSLETFHGSVEVLPRTHTTPSTD
ncbi:CapA family protein [Timonella sp. A28]|uniref:CapA family protein n=1 Tax=Timonella sp. A28 TaxID=3442640 RepID=UPI003EB80DB8